MNYFVKTKIDKSYIFTNEEYNKWFHSFDGYVKPVPYRV